MIARPMPDEPHYPDIAIGLMWCAKRSGTEGDPNIVRAALALGAAFQMLQFPEETGLRRDLELLLGRYDQDSLNAMNRTIERMGWPTS